MTEDKETSMSSSKTGAWIGAIMATAFTASCEGPTTDGQPGDTTSQVGSGLTAQQRIDACKQDPRVVTGLVTARLCAGADIFFRETFAGNGRTCGTCHPPQNNFTIDKQFIATLPA